MTRLPRQPSREAGPTIRGFEYQHLVGLDLWLSLKVGEALHVEVAEDLAPQREGGAEAYQVKATAGKVTLRQEKTRALLQEAWKRPQTLQTVLFTTSSVGREAGKRLLPDPGIEYWQRVQQGAQPSAPLRAFLLADGKLPKAFRRQLEKASPEAFEAFVNRVQWIANAPDFDAMERTVSSRLQSHLALMHGMTGRAAWAAQSVLPTLCRLVAKTSFQPEARDRVLNRGRLDREIEHSLLASSIISSGGGGSIAGAPEGLSVQSLRSAVDESVRDRLDAAQRRRIGGEERGALSDVQKIRGDASVWSAITDATKAAVLRLEARTQLDLDRPDDAKGLADQARVLSDEPDRRLDAAIVADLEGLEAALRALPDPQTNAERVTRAALLLRTGDASAALACLPQDKAVAPSIRIIATALTEGAVAAVEIATIAEATAPNDVSVLRASAFAHYAAAHSSLATLLPSAWPQPVDDMAVKSSDEATAHFAAAAERFHRCSNLADDAVTRLNTKAWELACRLSLPDSDQVASLARELAEASPPHPATVYWLVTRGLPLTLQDIADRLEASTRAGLATSDHVLALAIANKALGETAAPLSVLRDNEGLFRTPGERLLYEQWTRKWASPSGERTNDKDPDDDIASIVHTAKADGNWDRVALIATDESTEPILRASLLEELAVNERWPEVHSSRDLLVEGVATARAVRLWLYAAFEEEDWQGFVEVAHSRANDFPGSKLPYDLRRALAIALAQSGDWPQALSTGELLFAESREVGDALHLADLYGGVGRLADAARLIDDIQDLSTVASPLLQRWAARLSHEAPQVAGRLLSSLSERELEVALIPAAFVTSLEIEQNRELPKRLSKLLPRAIAEPESSGFRASNIDEVREAMIAHRDKAVERQGLYERGEAPAHLVFEGRLGLAFQGLLAPTDQPPSFSLLTRSGGRSEIEEIDFRNLALDVTALISAWGTGVYPVVLSSFEGVYVPNSTAIALQYLEKEARPSQPDVVAGARGALAALRSGLVQDGHRPTNAQVRPLAWKRDEDWTPTTLLLTHLLDWLVSRGKITQQRASAIGDDLGSDDRSDPELPLEGGEVLVLEPGLLEQIVRVDLLDLIAACFTIQVDAEERRRIEASVASNDLCEAVADNLRALRERVAGDLTGGSLKALPVRRPPAEDDGAGSGSKRDRDPLTNTLFELLGAQFPDSSGVWIEDRRLSAYRAIDTAPIVGTPEVISAMVARGSVTRERALDAMTQLRAAGERWIPLGDTEVLEALSNAPIVDGSIRETPPLRTIRRSINGDLAFLKYLQVAVPPRDDPSCESQTLSRMHSLGLRLLMVIWQQDVPSESKKAWSRWVWHTLIADRLDPPENLRVSAATERTFAVGRHARVISAVVLAHPLNQQADAAEWFWSDILHPLKRVDPTFYSEVLHELREELSDFGRASDDPTEDIGKEGTKLTALLARRAVANLPHSLQDDLIDEKLRQSMGLERPTGVITLGDVEIETDEFVRAAQAASSGGSASVRRKDGAEAKLVYEVGAAKIETTTGSMSIDPWVIGVSNPDEATWTKAAKGLLENVEASPELSEATLAKLSTETEVYRIATLHDAISRTVSQRLAVIEASMKEGGRFAADDLLPPSPEEMATWLEIGTGDEIDGGLEKLIARVGPLEALARCSWLSVLATPTWLDGIDRLDPAEVDNLSDFLCWTPVGAIAGGLIVARHKPDDTDDFVIRAAEAWQAYGEVWARLVTWTWANIERSREWADRSEALKLASAWAWADQVLKLIAQNNIDGRGIVDFLHRSRLIVRDVALRSASNSVTPHLEELHERVLARGVGAVLEAKGSDELGNSALEALRRALQSKTQEEFPTTSLIMDIRRLTAEGGLNQFPEELLATAFPRFPVSALATVDKEIAAAVEKLELNFSDGDSRGLLDLVGRFALDGQQVVRLIQAFARQADAATPAETLSATLKLIPHLRNPVAGGQAWREASSDLITLGEKCLGDPPRLEQDQDRLAKTVWEIGWATTLALPEQERADAIAKWTNSLSRAATPIMRQTLRYLVERVMETTPFDHRLELWRVVRAFRAAS